jgi:hypothetical protein
VRIVLFVEGYSERELPPFLKRWLDPRLERPIGIFPVRFEGNMAYLREVGRKSGLHLDQADTPPAKLLDSLMSRGGGHGYKKTTMARFLLPKLDPELVYQKCPNFKLLMDEMLQVAQQAA